MSGQDSEAQHTENEGKETTKLTETCRELHNVCVCVCVRARSICVCTCICARRRKRVRLRSLIPLRAGQAAILGCL